MNSSIHVSRKWIDSFLTLELLPYKVLHPVLFEFFPIFSDYFLSYFCILTSMVSEIFTSYPRAFSFIKLPPRSIYSLCSCLWPVYLSAMWIKFTSIQHCYCICGPSFFLRLLIDSPVYTKHPSPVLSYTFSFTALCTESAHLSWYKVSTTHTQHWHKSIAVSQRQRVLHTLSYVYEMSMEVIPR